MKEPAQTVNTASEAAAEVIAEMTGVGAQDDVRFVLWCAFCTENNIPVETLPSELSEAVQAKWEQLKEERLHKPIEER